MTVVISTPATLRFERTDKELSVCNHMLTCDPGYELGSLSDACSCPPVNLKGPLAIHAASTKGL